MGAHDVHVALDSDTDDSDIYEIVIGGYGNKYSVIRRGKQGSSINNGLVKLFDVPHSFNTTKVVFIIILTMKNIKP